METGIHLEKTRPSQAIAAPPLELMSLVGSWTEQSFREVGYAMFAALREECRLQPFENVLDIGCGCGRVALELMDFLDARATYDGFDCHPGMIAWCRQNISARAGNFRFQHVDVFNGVYAKDSAGTGSAARFPYADRQFDVVLAGSVFTHMLTQDMQRYIEEIYRVSKPGARAFCTFFLTDDPVSSGDEVFRIYNRKFVLDMFEASGFAITGVHDGVWEIGNVTRQDSVTVTRV